MLATVAEAETSTSSAKVEVAAVIPAVITPARAIALVNFFIVLFPSFVVQTILWCVLSALFYFCDSPIAEAVPTLEIPL
jgi:hypothetical protein